MKTTVSQSDFHDAFRACDRLENFSYQGRNALFDYLEEYENDTGEEIELDVIGLCCDYSEYPSALEAAKDMSSFEPDPEQDEEEQEEEALAYLQDHTIVIVHDEGVIVESF